MYKKAIVSRYFHEPITEMENRMTLHDIDKWFVVALKMIQQIDFIPTHPFASAMRK